MVFELCFGGFLSLLCLGCVELLPLPEGSESCLLQVILLFAFRPLVGVSFDSFLFFFFSLLLQYVGVVIALIKGEIKDHVVAIMAPYAISSSLILVIHDNMINGTNNIV
jgi:hypothetical protein